MYNLKNIMKRAWEIKKQDSQNLFSLCLKMAWEEEKTSKKDIAKILENYGNKPTTKGIIHIENIETFLEGWYDGSDLYINNIKVPALKMFKGKIQEAIKYFSKGLKYDLDLSYNVITKEFKYNNNCDNEILLQLAESIISKLDCKNEMIEVESAIINISSYKKIDVITRNGVFDGEIFSAKEVRSGVLVVDFNKNTEIEQQNKNTSIIHHELLAGIYNTDGYYTSHNINWENVKEVHGKTYSVKEFLKEKGFVWNKDKQAWTK